MTIQIWLTYILNKLCYNRLFMAIDGILLCLRYFQAIYFPSNNLQPKMITSYSLLQAIDPAYYANISSVF